jgi:hypothetical protein
MHYKGGPKNKFDFDFLLWIRVPGKRIRRQISLQKQLQQFL